MGPAVAAAQDGLHLRPTAPVIQADHPHQVVDRQATDFIGVDAGAGAQGQRVTVGPAGVHLRRGGEVALADLDIA